METSKGTKTILGATCSLCLLASCYTGLEGVGADAGSGTSGASGQGSDTSSDHGDSEGAGTDPDGCALLGTRIWKLTPSQYERTVTQLIPNATGFGARLYNTLPGTKAFTNEAPHLEMPQPHVEALLTVAGDLADVALTDPGQLGACLADGLDDEACMGEVLTDLVPRALRRPVAPEEIEPYLALYRDELAAHGGGVAVRQVLRALFMSVEFLYRSELGPESQSGEVSLTAYERAAALAYLILDGPPDATLLAAAEAGELDTRDQITTQVRRLLESPESARGIGQFFREYTHTLGVLDVEKLGTAFPDWNEERAAALVAETEAFVRHVVWGDDGRFETLLTSNVAVVDPASAPTYGVPAPPPGEEATVDLPAEQRSGLLTRAALMAALARPDEGDIVLRGKFIREEILCQELPPPPPDVDAFPPPADPDLTNRERLDRHRDDPRCAACHNLMDPLGYAFEIYDGEGIFRTTDNGKPVDASGVMVGTDQDGASYQDAIDLSRVLANSADAQACFVRKLLHYTHGAVIDESLACSLERAEARFAEHDGNIVELLVDIVADPDFLRRAAP